MSRFLFSFLLKSFNLRLMFPTKEKEMQSIDNSTNQHKFFVSQF